MTDSDYDCSHCEKIFDQHTNEEICIRCGLVVNDLRICFNNLYSNDVLNDIKTKNIIPFNNFEQILSTSSNINFDALNIVVDICKNNHINDQLQRKIIKKAISLNVDQCKKNIFAKIAYCIYTVFKTEQCQRQINDIAGMCNIPKSTLYQEIIKTDISCLDIDLPSQISSNVFNKLEINYQNSLEINEIADKLFKNYNYQPNVLLSAVIYLYYNTNQKHKCRLGSAFKISQACMSSSSALRRVRKAIQKTVNKLLTKK